MALFYDFLPVLLFFVAYKVWGIYVATGVMLAVSVAQIAFTWLRTRQVRKLHLITTVLVLVFGGLTLLIHDEIFVKWKPTVVEWLFAAAFLGSQWLGDKPLLRRALEDQIELPAPVWTRLNLAWAGFFALLGAANLYVVYQYSTEIWVNFKVFGLLGATLVFALAQGVYLARHLPDEDDGGRA